ncbi:MAG: DUF429 domain-containing protein [Dehalococcoidia bacterium]
MRLAGINLAWKSDSNTTAVAIGDLEGGILSVRRIEKQLSVEELKGLIREENTIAGVAVDAPLIITNTQGQRLCDKCLSKHYARQNASCYPGNLTLCGTRSPDFSAYLSRHGFEHLCKPSEGRFQIECYPHPAMIEIFELPERLKYKKGCVSLRRKGQMNLSQLVLALRRSRVMSLQIEGEWQKYVNAGHIASLVGIALKANEDVLDAVVCLYVAALFATSVPHKVYGSLESGYIYVPTQKCIGSADR